MIAAHKSENPAATGFNAANKNTRLDSTAEKSATTLIAKFALAGHAVHRLESGFLVTRWGMSRHCADFAALVNFGCALGVKL